MQRLVGRTAIFNISMGIVYLSMYRQGQVRMAFTNALGPCGWLLGHPGVSTPIAPPGLDQPLSRQDPGRRRHRRKPPFRVPPLHQVEQFAWDPSAGGPRGVSPILQRLLYLSARGSCAAGEIARESHSGRVA